MGTAATLYRFGNNVSPAKSAGVPAHYKTHRAISTSMDRNSQAEGSNLHDERFQMPFVEVHRHVPTDDRFVGLQHLEVAVALFGRNLEADVEQLPEMRVVFLAFRIVPERGAVLRGSPIGDRFL